jgi:hypothetical protein
LSKVISLLVSIFFIFLCIKDIPIKILIEKISFRADLILIAILFLYLINFLKAYRFKFLLSNYKKKKLSFYIKLPLIRQFVNSTLFGNLGEFILPFFFRKYLKTTYTEGFSIMVIERFLDLFFITLIFGFFLFFNNFKIFSNIIIIYFVGFFIFLFLTIFIMTTKNRILIKIKMIKHFQIGYQKIIKSNNHILKIFFLTFMIWIGVIIIDLFIFNAFDVTRKISTLPNIVFIAGVIIITQLIPSAPSSIGVFNYFVVEAITLFYKIQNLEFNLQIKAELTSVSMIILIIYILPDITWGTYLFFKETQFKLNKIKDYFIKYTK